MSRGQGTKRARRPPADRTRGAVAAPSPASPPRRPPDQAAGNAPRERGRRAGAGATLGLAVALIAITAIAYAPVRHNGFISLDDAIYVADNAHVRAGLTWSGLVWAFTTSYANFWHPLTWLSIMLDVQLWGLNAGLHHVTSVLLHIGSALLLFLALRRMTGAAGRSALVAALFAVHPLHVESVAWIAERKDTLSTVFWMLTLWAYAGYVRQPRWSRYALVLACFVLGLMAKPMLVTLPFVLLLLDVWPLHRVTLEFGGAGRARRPALSKAWMPLVREKVPFFALAVAASLVAIVAQRSGGAVAALDAFPLSGRAANAALSYLAYIAKTIWPAGLVPFYPYPQAIPVLPVVGAIVVLAGISIVVVRLASRRPYLAVGWFWYVSTLVPVIGLVQVGSHAMADRYTYVPLVGLFIMAAWGVPDLVAFAPRRARDLALAAVASCLILASVVATRAQVMTWKDSVTLWQHALDVMPDNYYAHNGLGLELDKQGRASQAMAHFVQASRLAPGFPNAHLNLGLLLARAGRPDEALAEYDQALRLAPHYLQAHINLGYTLRGIGRAEQAIAHYREALRLQPESAEVRTNLGNALLAMGRAEPAMALYREAIGINPDFADAHYNLANALQRGGRVDQAVAEYAEALRLEPGSVEAHNNLGTTLERLGRPAEAMAQYRESVRLDPHSAQAHTNLGNVLLGLGRVDEAAAEYREALRIDPRDPRAHTNLGSVLQEMGRLDEAVAEHREAIRLNPAYADAHFNLGNALARMGNLDAAAAQYQETLRLEGDSEEVRAALSAVLKRGGRGHSAPAGPTVAKH